MMALQSSESKPGLQSVASLVGHGMGKLVLETQAGQCKLHGDYIDKLMRGMGGQPSWWTGCPQCRQADMQERAMREQREQMARDVAEAAKARAAAMSARLERSGVPRRFLDATWDGYRTTDTAGEGVGTQSYALARCRAYADRFAQNFDDGRTLFLLGNPGTGKNHLATCIARQVAAAGHSVVFATAEVMLKAWRDVVVHKVEGNKGELGLLRDFSSPDLLVIDELFRKQNSEAAMNFLFDVINARYERRVPTMLISNKTLQEVKELMDHVLVSRLQERGAIMVPFPWEDQRPNVARGGN